MAFIGTEHIRAKIFVRNKGIEYIEEINYLGGSALHTKSCRGFGIYCSLNVIVA